MEGDAALTADGHVVLHHDHTVDRTTNGTGEINKMTLAEVKALDAGYRLTLDGGKTFPYRGKGATIATLKEALEALPVSNFLIEFKPYPGIVEATIAAIREVGAEDRVLLASFTPEHMRRARELAAEMAMCYDFDNGTAMLETLRNGAWSEYAREADVLSLMRRMVNEFSLTPEEIQAIRAKGIRFQIHTVDDPEEMAMYLNMGVDSILSDRPDLLVKAVEAWRGRS
jgi:glycerophosphoryl diester phosphodiesterase